MRAKIPFLKARRCTCTLLCAIHACPCVRNGQIVPCNIGNPHACLQVPLSFHREVLSLCIRYLQYLSDDLYIRGSCFLSYLSGGERYVFAVSPPHFSEF